MEKRIRILIVAVLLALSALAPVQVTARAGNVPWPIAAPTR